MNNEEQEFKAMTPEERKAAEEQLEIDQAADDAAAGRCLDCGS